MNAPKIRRYSCVAALLISGCVSASASVTVYTNRNLWLTATANVITVDFEGIAGPNAIVTYDTSPGILTVGPDSFQGFDNTASTQHDMAVNNDISPNWNSGAVLEGPPGNNFGQHLVAALSAGVFAVGSDIMMYDGSTSPSDTITAQLSTGPTIYSAQTTSGFASRAFIGFVSDTQISSITFFPSGDQSRHLILDNFSTGGQAASPTPETATLILCGIGLLLMRRLWRKTDSQAEPHRGAARSPFVTAGAEA
jgi:hypothetical protein